MYVPDPSNKAHFDYYSNENKKRFQDPKKNERFGLEAKLAIKYQKNITGPTLFSEMHEN